VIFITHDMSVVSEIADQVLVLKSGDLVERKTVAEIFNQPEEEYTKNLIKSVPVFGNYSQSEKLVHENQKNSCLLEVKNVSKTFLKKKGFFSKSLKENKALQNVSLEIRAGQTLSIVGESGSGKTTLARCVTKLISSDDGEINFNGKNLNRISKKELNLIRREIQFIFQDPYASLNPRMPVNYLVTEPLHIHGEIKKKENTEHASRLLNEVKLDDSYLNRYPHELSGGQRQRICIARALALKPKLIVADEPLSALDVTIQSQIIDLLLELQLKFQLSFLVISHDLAVVEKISHHVGVMCKGRLVEFGKTNEVLYDPRHNYTKLLLNSIPKINKDRKAKTIKEVNLLDTDYSKKFEFLKDSTYINVSKDHFYLTD
jgi:ABC-type glutathione transport system ATPase component